MSSSFDFSWLLPLIPYIVMILNVLLIGYNIKLVRDNINIKKWTEMLKHSSLSIKMEGIEKAQIGLTNVGHIPIDEVETDMDCSIKNHRKKRLNLTYHRDTILMSKEVFTIPLFEELEPFLLEQKLLNIHYEEIPTGTDPITGQTILDEIEVRHILKQFSIKLALEVDYTVHKETKKLYKQFLISYSHVPEYGDPFSGDSECRYTENYFLKFNDISGRWIS